MVFERKSFWMPRYRGCLTNSEMAYSNSSRVESKRGHQWFMDENGAELLSNKKQVIEAVNSRSMSGITNMNAFPWDNASSFQPLPGQFTDRLFGTESVQTASLADRNDSSLCNENMIMGRKDFADQYLKNPSMSLSMTRTVEDPSSFLSFGGIRKVKVNEVRDFVDGRPISMGHLYGRGDNSAIIIGANHSKTDSNIISLGSTYNNGDENSISMGLVFRHGDDSFDSVGHSYNKGEGSFIVMSDNYTKEDERILSMGQPLDKMDGNFISMGQLYGKGANDAISMAPFYSKAHENFFSMGSSLGTSNENFISKGSCYNKENDNIIPTGQTYGKVDHCIVTIGSRYDKGDPNILSMGQTYSRGQTEGNSVSFPGFHDEPEMNTSGGIISSYDLLMSTQNVAQNSEAPGQKDLVESNVEPITDGTPKTNSKADAASKNKEPKTSKKLPPNNFPANVKSLLSTGMLDGVRVKYVSWSREKNLHGVIKGVAYMCGCKDCQYAKPLNAYEFERHAGCKTKHPNNHIYFENGKTIYAAVQELKNTPPEALFDAIEKVTGSSVHQKNFRLWKASYTAATIELQRIYGKDEVVIPS